MTFLFNRSKRRMILQRADRTQVRLQRVVDQIRHDYPAAAAAVADAGIVIGRLAAVISDGDGE
jgi:hypothetical protein